MKKPPTEYIRKIIHIDMDAFYASVEQRDNPDLRGKPVAVGGSKKRGVVAAASYEARQFGIHSALASSIAYRHCPQLIFVKPNFEKYRAVSEQIRTIFLDYTPWVEPLSLDEAYLDVTENLKGITTATRIAYEIRKRIYDETQLTASAGISINKFMAKVASDYRKPNGQKTIMPHEVLPFLEQLPINKFFGVGKKTGEKMKKLGIHRGYDLKQWDQALLVREFGKSGTHYYNIVRGIQHSRVKPNRIRKSVGAERTFSKNLNEEESLRALEDIMLKLSERVALAKAQGKTITLKIKYHNFEVHTRSQTLNYYTQSSEEILHWARRLLLNKGLKNRVRLLGITLSNLKLENQGAAAVQLTLDF